MQINNLSHQIEIKNKGEIDHEKDIRCSSNNNINFKFSK